MDIKVEIKEEYCNSDVSHEREIRAKDVVAETNCEAVLQDYDCNMAVEAEIKPEPPDVCLQENRHALTQIKSETVVCSNINTETTEEQPYSSQNKQEFLSEDSVMKNKQYNEDDEIDKKVEIKQECCWLEAEPMSIFGGIKNEDFPPVTSPRLYTGVVSEDCDSKSSLPPAEDSGNHTSSYNAKGLPEPESQESDIEKITSLEESVVSEEPAAHHNRSNICNRASYVKQKCVIYKGKRTCRCEICEKSSVNLSDLKKDILSHRGENSHKCETCDHRFDCLSQLRMHQLTHTGKKSHECEVCGRSFTVLTHLKMHTLLHKGEKPQKCETCGKSFTQWSHLKKHTLIHTGEKPHRCDICGKSFTQWSHLKRHSSIHTGEKPYKCEICGNKFTTLSYLKVHALIHTGGKPYKCEICESSFVYLSQLKTHTLVHTGEKPHKCETCGKSFAKLSNLKVHAVIHTGEKPYKCDICEKSFITLSKLKQHNSIHTGEKPRK